MNEKALTSKRARRIAGLVLCDIFLINVSAFLALVIRFEFDFVELHNSGFIWNFMFLAPVITGCGIIAFIIFRLYSSMWGYAGPYEFGLIVLASISADILQSVIMLVAGHMKGIYFPLPKSFPAIYLMLLILLLTFERFSYRYIRSSRREKSATRKKRTMIIGAGGAGNAAFQELAKSSASQNKVVVFIDDNPAKVRRFIQGVPIAGGRDTIVENVKKYRIEEIIVALPGASRKERKKIIEICNETDAAVKTLPSLSQLVNGEVKVNQIRKVDVEDLLGRDEIKIDASGISDILTGRSVVVTGGGGSIGSELCRQIAVYGPKCLTIFDIYENNAYALQQELLRKHPGLNLKVLIGSVRDIKRIKEVFEEVRPDMVFHAAAHKHVPLMEDSPAEAIKNNVFGTLNVARCCDLYKVKKMVLISTDKAVRPTNIMGASKRVCEMIVQMLARTAENTSYAAVRFGNVLGSNGSVIPLFRKQIEQGGPVTVTHKDIIRYFMTIPEAVSLILQAGTYAKGGEIYVLDMGEPVKIDDLARNMIRMSGFEPGVDINIEYTGLRPGEKLYEELLLEEEGLTKTENELIYIGKPIEIDDISFSQWLGKLASKLNVADYAEGLDDESLGVRVDDHQLKEMMKEVVTDFKI